LGAKEERGLIVKAKWMTLLAGAMVLTGVLFTGFPLVGAASPTGEVKTVAAVIGKEIPIPWLEMAASSNDWMQLLYDHLVGTTPGGKFSPDLGLAHKWEMGRDGLTWTFYLRKGVRFHDGVELTAKDVKFSIEQFMLPEASLHYSASFFREAVKGIEVRDPYTVVILCKKPTIFLLNWLSNLESTSGMVVPKDYYEKVGRDEFAKHPIGSRPERDQ
jgi:ABC-type transport system substrate-binding protein